ncbi:MAG: hypothetical protein QF754_19965 [Alphaproteobacteria bacterium]|nr:hypothetical protein [Alphaproteobacteria bacterium]
MDDDAFLAFRRQTYGQLRRASDRVRLELIPDFAARRVTAHQAFYAINRSYFEEDVFHGQMVGHNDSLGFFADGASDPFYSTELDDLGGPPAGRGTAGGFETLHPRFAEAVIARTFAALEEVGPFNDEVSFLQMLAIVDFLFQVAHFAKDGSGRSGEDLLVLLGLRHGAPLTFSVTGYRGAIEGPERLMSLRHVTQKIAQIEVAQNFFRYLGLTPPQATATHIRELLESLIRVNTEIDANARHAPLTWPNDLGGTIEAIFDPLAPADDEAVARLELVRHERLAREDIALAQLLEQLVGSAPDLAPLIDAERAFLPLEPLLERLRVPMTREDLPEVIRQHLKTVSTFDSPPN